MDQKTITIKVKNEKRFLWGLNEFYPDVQYKVVDKCDTFTSLKISYFQTTPKDKVAGYVKGFRDW